MSIFSKPDAAICCDSHSPPVRQAMQPTQARMLSRIYRAEDAREFLSGQGMDVDAIAPQVDGKFFSAFIRAVKPVPTGPTCCGPTCCN